ncbi:unnamed protein product [Adineta steineri]|uniref:NHL repeat containing protein n=2 Tax=Adineta steineri TaxID=433720 RepID=A0A815GQ90_9BILA|nr:unnamed protein product [Adineta steineri]CAF1341529.1 unnamed protein product [Adineta steineri]CAF1357263.1 unnamed protein product [Adineta steineri]
MEYKKPLIGTNESEDIEMAAERVTVYDASPEYKPESENKNNIRRYNRPRTGSSLFHRKPILILTIIAVLSLITIISFTIWAIFIKKIETTITTTASTSVVSTTKTTMLATSTITTTTMLTTSTSSHTITMNEPKWDKWKQNAITVAGGNGEGQKLNQFRRPRGIFIDQKKNIFIADVENHRIVEWKYNAKEGQIIAGGNGQGNRMDQLSYPQAVIIDQQNHSIIIADLSNRRVIQWLNQNQQILIDNIACDGLAIDKDGFIYVSDYKKNEVRRWKMGEYKNEGIVVAGGNGQGNQLNQLYDPTYLFVDKDQSIYVTDWDNYRVMKWIKDAKEGKIVAGGNGQGKNLNQLSDPAGVIVNDLGQIYVADSGNDRIMRWCEGKEEGEIVVGGNGEGIQSNQLYSPRGLSFDDEGNLYVVDRGNHRVQKFEIIL